MVLPFEILPDRPEVIREAMQNPEPDLILVSFGWNDVPEAVDQPDSSSQPTSNAMVDVLRSSATHAEDRLTTPRDDGIVPCDRMSEIRELRHSIGLSQQEYAELLGLSPRKCDQLWAYARAWLLDAMDDD